MNIGDLFVRLGFDVDDKKLQSFDKGVSSLVTNFNLSTVAIGAAIYALDRFIESSIRAGTSIYNFNQQTGLSQDKLQQWQVAASLSNTALSVDDVTSSIQALENNLLEIRKFGSGNIAPYAFLGINPGEVTDAFDLLDKIRDKLSTVDRITATNLLQKFGLNPGFINILTKSKDEFDALTAGMRRSDESVKELERLGESLAKIKLEFGLLKDNIVVDIAPGLIEAFGKIEKSIMRFKEFGDEFPNAMHRMAIGAGVLLAVLNPVAAALVGIVAAIDDIMAYRKGEDSWIGNLLKGNAADNVKKVISDADLDASVEGLAGITNRHVARRSSDPSNISVTNKGGDTNNGNKSSTLNYYILQDSDIPADARPVFEEQKRLREIKRSFADFSGAGQ